MKVFLDKMFMSFGLLLMMTLLVGSVTGDHHHHHRVLEETESQVDISTTTTTTTNTLDKKVIRTVEVLIYIEYGFDLIFVREPTNKEYDGLEDETKDFFKDILKDVFPKDSDNDWYEFEDLDLEITAISFEPSAFGRGPARPVMIDYYLHIYLKDNRDLSSDSNDSDDRRRRQRRELSHLSIDEQVLFVIQTADYDHDYIPNYVHEAKPDDSIFEDVDEVLTAAMVPGLPLPTPTPPLPTPTPTPHPTKRPTPAGIIEYHYNIQIDFNFGNLLDIIDQDDIILPPLQDEINENTRVTRQFYQRQIAVEYPTVFAYFEMYEEQTIVTNSNEFPLRSYYTVTIGFGGGFGGNIPSANRVLSFLENVDTITYVPYVQQNQFFGNKDSIYNYIMDIVLTEAQALPPLPPTHPHTCEFIEVQQFGSVTYEFFFADRELNQDEKEYVARGTFQFFADILRDEYDGSHNVDYISIQSYFGRVETTEFLPIFPVRYKLGFTATIRFYPCAPTKLDDIEDVINNANFDILWSQYVRVDPNDPNNINNLLVYVSGVEYSGFVLYISSEEAKKEDEEDDEDKNEDEDD